jgi:voltage-gated potassium channel
MEETPLHAISRRILVALGLVTVIATVAYLGRDGYVDGSGESGISILDAFYYATVSVTTTGYGDITPVTDQARLMTTLIITPMRVLFLILLVGTTVEVLASHTKLSYKVRRLQRQLNNHTVICGYGVKGQSAVEYLRGSNQLDPNQTVVIDASPQALERANAMGLVAIEGSGSESDILRQACIERASTVLIAPDQDDAAVLITLRVHELNPEATIVVTCREEGNVKLLEGSGADKVIVSSAAAGRLLGLASKSPGAAGVVTDLLSSGRGLEIKERNAEQTEHGLHLNRTETFLAIERDGEMLNLGDPETGELRAGDKIVYIQEK